MKFTSKIKCDGHDCVENSGKERHRSGSNSKSGENAELQSDTEIDMTDNFDISGLFLEI